MRKFLLFVILTLAIHNISLSAASDTLLIRSHDNTHLNWYGNFYTKTKFPSADSSYKQILMKYTIGCPTKGCSEWDYTTKVFARRKTGIDTVVTNYPKYRLNTQNFDSLIYSSNPTYVTFYSVSKQGTDSTMSASQKLYFFMDSTQVNLKTDSLNVYAAGYKNYYYNASGQIIDSIIVSGTKIYQSYWKITTYNTLYEYIEFARYITPYAGDKNFGFYRDFIADVTHYRSVLTDSVEIGVKFEGYQDGFTVSLDYYFIKGEPLREAYKVIPLYYGGFPYGSPNNSIENYLPALDIKIDADAQEAAVEILQTGHGFGGNENCAEFCEKFHYLKLNGIQRFSSPIWKNDCGMNPLYPQPGTWLYDRANWCPGEMVRPIYYDITNFIKADSNLNINLDMQPFVNNGNNNCSYNIAANLILYKNRKGAYDLELQEIVAPSADWENSRFNPTCGNPIIKVRNNGSDLNGFSIEYGIKNTSRIASYVHTGILKMHETITLNLDPLEMKSGEIFYARVIPNLTVSDFDLTNNEKESIVPKVTLVPNKFFIEFRTNGAAYENEYEVSSLNKSFVHTKWNFNNNTTYRDTLNLANGCYTFKLIDLDKDGLSFFANSDGAGYVRFRNMSGTTFQTFRADFGTEIRFQFVVDSTMTGIDNEKQDIGIHIYPNPSQGIFNILNDLGNPIKSIKVIGIDGKICRVLGQIEQLDRIELNLSDLSNGMYIFEIESLKGIHREKVEINR